jgi:lysozyme family protein
VTVKELPDAYAKSFKDIDERNRQAQEEADKKKRIQDGQPHKRTNTDTEFMG